MTTLNNLKRIFKTTGLITLLIFVSLTITSCKKDKQKYIDNAIAIVYKGQTPYLINASKEDYSLAKYDEIEQRFDKYIGVKKDSLWGFIDNTGKEIIKPSFTKVYPMNEEKAVVFMNNICHIINLKGEIIYTFKDGYYAESSFSENHLVITNGDTYTYLYLENNTFKVLDQTFDSLAPYRNGYGIVGKYDTKTEYVLDEEGNPTDQIDQIITLENLKYNLIDQNHQLFLDTFEYDFFDYFYDGYARCGKIETIDVSYYGSYQKIQTTEMMYEYLAQDKSKFTLNHRYEHSFISGKDLIIEQVHDTSVVKYPYATNFNQGLCVTAKLLYNSQLKKFIKQFHIIDKFGQMDYTDAIYAETTYRFGYDTNKDYQTQTPSIFYVRKPVIIDDILVLNIGNTLSSTSWQVKFAQYDLDRHQYLFIKADFDFKKTDVVPQWMIDFNQEYVNGSNNYFICEQTSKTPYELDDFRVTSFYDRPLAKQRLNYSHKYGLITTYKKNTTDTSGRDSYHMYSEYVLDPIYDNIIY